MLNFRKRFANLQGQLRCLKGPFGRRQRSTDDNDTATVAAGNEQRPDSGLLPLTLVRPGGREELDGLGGVDSAECHGQNGVNSDRSGRQSPGEFRSGEFIYNFFYVICM